MRKEHLAAAIAARKVCVTLTFDEALCTPCLSTLDFMVHVFSSFGEVDKTLQPNYPPFGTDYFNLLHPFE